MTKPAKMAMAKPVVLTPEAATGIAARDGVDWLVCQPDPDAMTARLADLLTGTATSARIGAAARAFVLEHHGWESMMAPLSGLLAMRAQDHRHAA